MARIRTIKPEFFTSDDIVSMTPLARLFYVSLWCEADREGRLEWKPRTLKLRYLPGDNCNIEELANELIEGGLIVLYEVDGKEYAEILSFKKHQVINNRESESKIPSRVTHASPTRESGVLAEGKGKEGKGKDIKPMSGKPDDAPKTKKETPETISPENLAAKETIDYLNQKTGANYRDVEANLKFVRARLAEGATVDEIKAVIDMKAREWSGTDSAKYLRPETLFNATKYNQYVGQVGGMRQAEHKQRGVVL
tara:strand:+ start:560 stop:1318 length:759 start_codon:yes stop_codon:yes gene_type:complete